LGSRRRYNVRVHGKLLTIPLMIAAAGATATPATALTRHHTPAGQALAASALLRRADFGRGWRASAAPAPGRITCPGYSPATAGVVEQGAVASPDFERTADERFVSESAYAYASGAQRALFWHRVVRPRLLRCLAQSFVHSSGHGVRFAVTGKRVLPAPKLSVSAAAYRVSGTATTAGQPVDVFLDVLVLGSGARLSELSIATVGAPVERAFELRLARVVAGRMAGR
jgi:hypothetical protein